MGVSDQLTRSNTMLEQFRFLGISTKGESPIAPDCVVELVGLEPTTKVLWNMVGVRPTPLVGHPSRTPGVLLFCSIFLAFLYLNQPPECYGTWFESDQLPWSVSPDRRAFVVFRDYPGSWSDSNRNQIFKESGSSPTSPPSGRPQVIPELDRVAWFEMAEARQKILKGQAIFLDRLSEVLA